MTLDRDTSPLGVQQIYELATSLGIDQRVARRLSQFASTNSIEMKNHMVLNLAKADLALSEEINSERIPGPTGTIQRVTFRCEFSTITLNIHTSSPNAYIIDGVRQTSREVCPIIGLTYDVFQTIRNTRGHSIDVMNDIIAPLNAFYENIPVSQADWASEDSSPNWHTRFGTVTSVEQMTSTGRTQRSSALFAPKKREIEVLLKSTRDQLEALRSYENIEEIHFDKRQDIVKIITKPISSGRIPLGSFEFLINLKNYREAVMRRLPHNLLDTDKELWSQSTRDADQIWKVHPFVKSTTKDGYGSICFGDADGMYEDSIRQRDIFSAVNIILELIVSKTGNPYTPWSQYLGLLERTENNTDNDKR